MGHSRLIRSVFALVGAVYVSGSLPSAAVAQGTSVCVSVRNGCHVPGAVVTTTIDLGVSASVVSSGQFSILYDPAALALISVAPGAACDPTSPFSIIIHDAVDPPGEVFFGVSVDYDGAGSQGPTTLACLSFLLIDPASQDVCLVENAQAPRLIDENGRVVPVDNSVDCPSGLPSPALSCDQVESASTCLCAGALPDCSFWSDDCNVGFCNETTTQCEALPINDGGSCNDGNDCTLTDTCDIGVCVGSGCADPSLCLITEAVCQAAGETEVQIKLGQGQPAITAGQFTIQYDPASFDFLAISPGRFCDPTSPFDFEIFEVADEAVGDIFYAVGVNPFLFGGLGLPTERGTGAQGPATMACLRLAVLGVGRDEICLVDGESLTLLVDEFGQGVVPFNLQDCPTGAVSPAITCENISVGTICACVPGQGDCSLLDTQCRVGVCDGNTNECVTVPANEGEVCDDSDRCTMSETCVAGECTAGEADVLPSLCVVTQGLDVQSGFVAEVSVVLGESATEIVGGQFSIQYDPTALKLISIQPGRACDPASPFALQLSEIVDETQGEAVYAVGIELGGVGTTGPATMACLTFQVNDFPQQDVCLFNGLNPFNTVLVAASGRAVCISNENDCPTSQPLPAISCDDIPISVPTVSGWGLVVLILFLLVAGKIRAQVQRSTRSAN